MILILYNITPTGSTRRLTRINHLPGDKDLYYHWSINRYIKLYRILELIEFMIIANRNCSCQRQNSSLIFSITKIIIIPSRKKNFFNFKIE